MVIFHSYVSLPEGIWLCVSSFPLLVLVVLLSLTLELANPCGAETFHGFPVYLPHLQDQKGWFLISGTKKHHHLPWKFKAAFSVVSIGPFDVAAFRSLCSMLVYLEHAAWLDERIWNGTFSKPRGLQRRDCMLVGGLEHFLVFHNIWDNPSHWLIFFRGIETTNQIWFSVDCSFNKPRNIELCHCCGAANVWCVCGHAQALCKLDVCKLFVALFSPYGGFLQLEAST